MAMITRFDPFREMTNLQSALSRIMQTTPSTSDELMATGNFIPPVDVYEDEHNITLKLEIPGVDQKDLDIRLENNTITVRGERKFEKEEKEENFHRIERRYGAFSRSFTLPNTVDPDKATANYENGVLSIQLAKKAEAKPKQIKVGIGKEAGKVIEAKEGKGKEAA